MSGEIRDILVIGGGINGVGIAADAAGRGLSVTLCEMNDLASATSSNSSKLIHGGLRYLEYHEYRLVREALAEREVLLKKAPHIIEPLRIRLPHQAHLRPAWLIRIGLFLYDHLSKRNLLKGSHSVKFGDSDPLNNTLRKGFEFSDARVDDARLVILNAFEARNQGAEIKTRSRCVEAVRVNELWKVTLENQLTGSSETLYARALVNAAGPWVSHLFNDALKVQPEKQIRLVKGSHIIVPKIHTQTEAYMLQNEDERIVFVIPYEEDFSLIGTTDVEHEGDPGAAEISTEEVDYLIEITNQYFKAKLAAKDIVATYSGVRPLISDESENAQAVTRDYTFELSSDGNQAPLLSIYGGKITTYRKLAEAVVDRLSPFFPLMTAPWTATQHLPGGDFSDRRAHSQSLARELPWLPSSLCERYTRTYGTLCKTFLQGVKNIDDMGEHLGGGLYQREVDYLFESEWAKSAEDILWRRTKLGLVLTDSEQDALNQYILQTYGLEIALESQQCA